MTVPATRFSTPSGFTIASVLSSMSSLTFACGLAGQHALDGLPDRGGGVDDVEPRLGERYHLLDRRPLPAGDDRAGMSHPASRGRGPSGDERDHGLPHVPPDEL